MNKTKRLEKLKEAYQALHDDPKTKNFHKKLLLRNIKRVDKELEKLK